MFQKQKLRGTLRLSSMLVAATLVLSGCDEGVDFVKRKLVVGTNVGVMSCVTANKKYSETGLSPDIVNRLCVEKHEEQIYTKRLPSGCSILKSFADGSYLRCQFENTTRHLVITGVMAEVQSSVENGNKKELVISSGAWIEPLGKNYVRFPAFKGALRNWTPSPDEKNSWSWKAVKFWGVKVRLKE